MKKCPRCGHMVSSNASFCDNCGFKFNVQTQSQPQSQQPVSNPNNQAVAQPKMQHHSSKGIITFIIILIIIVVLLCGGFFYTHSVFGTNLETALPRHTWTATVNMPTGKSVAHGVHFKKDGQFVDNNSNDKTSYHLTPHSFSVRDPQSNNNGQIVFDLNKVSGHSYHFHIAKVDGMKAYVRGNRIRVGKLLIVNRHAYDGVKSYTVPAKNINKLKTAINNGLVLSR